MNLFGSVAVKVVLEMSSKVKSLSTVPRGLQTAATSDPVKVHSHCSESEIFLSLSLLSEKVCSHVTSACACALNVKNRFCSNK